VSAVAAALRPGLSRGVIELRQSFSGSGLVANLLWPVVTLVAVYLLRDSTFEGSNVALGTIMLPSVLGMFVALGVLLVIQYLAADREDGTLLRARATPNGIRGYYVGKLVTVSGTLLAYEAILLLPGLLIVHGLAIDGLRSWLTMGWVLLLGLVGTQSIGAVLGALVSSPRGAGYASLPVMALVAISGIFYPITALAGWVQVIAQLFPMYWLGLGMRAALLPDAYASIEIGGSWRQPETFAILGAWALLGTLLAPIVLRQMARRESGSNVAKRRDEALQRVG
jgi:ABC-2 type transport system permease protein